MSLYSELKRRNVIRAAIAYLAGAWLLIQIADTVFPAYGLPETSVGYLITALAIGFFPAMVLAWVFEFTSEGIRRESDELVHGGTRRLDRAIIVVLVLALGYFSVDKFLLDPARDAEREAAISEQARGESLISSYGEQSIAVLPFEDMSPQRDQEYFANGMSEEVLNLLASIPEIRVISRSSSFSFKGKEIHIPTVAAQLNVAHILEGSVRKDGNRLRITAQLIEAKTDTHLWSDTFDRELDDVFAIQDEISAAVVEALKVTLLGDLPTMRVTNTEALDLNLRARFVWTRRADGDLERARELWEQVVELDPSNSEAWAGIAVSWQQQMRLGEVDQGTGAPKSMHAALKAVEADPESGVAHLRLAHAYSWSGDEEAELREQELAFRIEPNHPIIMAYRGWDLQSKGRFDEAIDLHRTVTKLDPMSAISWGNLAIHLADMGLLAESEEAMNRAIELGYTDMYMLAKIRLLQGKYEEVLELSSDIESPKDKAVFEIIATFELGDKARSDLLLAECLADACGPFNLAVVYAWRGQYDEAFHQIEQFLADIGNEYMYILEPDGLLRPLHDQPRWQTLMASAPYRQKD